jgi:hypothetical protein
MYIVQCIIADSGIVKVVYMLYMVFYKCSQPCGFYAYLIILAGIIILLLYVRVIFEIMGSVEETIANILELTSLPNDVKQNLNGTSKYISYIE